LVVCKTGKKPLPISEYEAEMYGARFQKESFVKGKLLVIPFCYPYYPEKIIADQVERSKQLLNKLSPVFINPVSGRKEAQKAKDAIRNENPDLVVALIVSWIEAPHLIDSLREYFGSPLVLWSHKMIQENGKRQTLGAFVAAGVVRQSLEDFEVPFEFIYGPPDDENVLSEIETIYRAAKAVRKLKNARIGLAGYTALGMYTGTFDHITMKKKFGPEIVHLDQYQIIKKMEDITDAEAHKINSTIKEIAEVPDDICDEDLMLSSKMYLAFKRLIEENELDALSVKCQYELSQLFKYTPCVALSLLGNEVTASCEGDILTVLTQLILHYISSRIVSYVDIHDVSEGKVLAAACGFAPFLMSEKGRCRIDRWGWESFNGVLNTSELKNGRVTIARIARDGVGLKMHVAAGFSVQKSEWNEVGCPPFPGTDIVLDGDSNEFVKELVSNHYALVFGDVKEELEVLCGMLGVHYINT